MSVPIEACDPQIATKGKLESKNLNRMPKLQQRCKKLLKIAKLQKIEFVICCLYLLNVRTTDNITLITTDHKAGTSKEVGCSLSLRIKKCHSLRWMTLFNNH